MQDRRGDDPSTGRNFLLRFFVSGDGTESGLVRNPGSRLQSRNVPSGTFGDSAHFFAHPILYFPEVTDLPGNNFHQPLS